ncbi:hypothetical protein FLAG1_09062 [Fusarium langsethiae]|uniref:Uncharacterized protein n=1 Tax=Fusarium langsethiae TaxID=179993 RepID=A0A0M9ERG7_FUSLA|nr:hypothetical protein FLAG1_09062 [Fusarium langsethiae]GKU06671.1 unnamed protein product [Fusarium langsethiae]
MSCNILLQNGSVIVHDDNNRTQVIDNCDVLISNGVIKQLRKEITPNTDLEVLDCTEKIISPGFVDTHHHLWQTQLKGHGLDNCWLDYFSDVAITAHYCTVAEAAIAAFDDSGIRGVFAYAETFLNLAKWDAESCIPRATSISDTYIEHIESLAHRGPFADGRVILGVAFDNYHLPQNEIEKLFHMAIDAGVKIITSHCGNFGPSVPQALERYSLFPSSEDDYTIVLSHGNYLGKPDLAMLSERHIPIACTPATEAQGSMGWPLLFEPGLNTALGADCHFLNSSSLMQAARSALLLSRLQKTLELKSQGSKPVKFDETTHDVFNKATIQGARAVGMQDQIGSIKVAMDISFALNSTIPIMFTRAFGAFALFNSFSLTQATPITEKQCGTARWEHKPRLFVLTDISNEPDDQMSLVRLLTYANEINIQGIAVTTSTWMPDKIDYEAVVGVLKGYEKVVGNLNANVPSRASYPSYKHILGRVHKGHPVYGRKSLNMTLSDGAKALITAADEASAHDPLTVSVWGGSAILAESLQHVSHTRSQAATDSFVEKLRVYAISDQDDTGIWIRLRYPQLMYVVSLHGFSEYTDASWNGISGEEYHHFDQGGPDSSLVSNDWLEKNIRLGPLGSHYLNWSFIMEGDTPAFLPLVQNGLGDVNRPDFGSWGGRYTLLDHSGQSRVYTDTTDYVVGKNGKSFTSKFATIWRWREDYQFDFAARMKWSVNCNYSENNHQPVAIVNGSCGPAPLKLKYKPGQSIVIDASDSWDPDGDELKYDWFHYREPGGYGRGLEGFDPSLKMNPILTTHSPNVNITNLNSDGSLVKLETAKKLNDTLHIILALRDAIEQPLATYRRVILEAN